MSEKIEIEYSIDDVAGYIGWSRHTQAKICKEAGIEPLYGFKRKSIQRQKIQMGYSKEQFEKLLLAGNYVKVSNDIGETFLVLDKRLKSLPEGYE